MAAALVLFGFLDPRADYRIDFVLVNTSLFELLSCLPTYFPFPFLTPSA